MDNIDNEQQTTQVESTTAQQGNTTIEKQTVRNEATVSTRTMVERIVWFIIGFIAVVIAIRIVLMLLGANQGNAFVDFIYSLGGFFAAPFFGIFGYSPAYGGSVFEISSLVAILVYVLIGWGITKALNISSPKEV